MKSNKLILQAMWIIGMILLGAFTTPNKSVKMKLSENYTKSKSQLHYPWQWRKESDRPT